MTVQVTLKRCAVFFAVSFLNLSLISLSRADIKSDTKVANKSTTSETIAKTTLINEKGDYVIGVDDSILVSVWRNPTLSITVPVRPDGKISTPLVGDVLAEGLTPTELSEVIRDKLSKFIRQPQVSIIMQSLTSHEYLSRVRVTGAVNQPMSIPFRKGMTVLDLILAAGGATDFASPNKTVIYRKVKQNDIESMASETIKLKDILKKGKLETNYQLKPGDIITVPEGFF